jgi:hypothetical protein
VALATAAASFFLAAAVALGAGAAVAAGVAASPALTAPAAGGALGAAALGAVRRVLGALAQHRVARFLQGGGADGVALAARDRPVERAVELGDVFLVDVVEELGGMRARTTGSPSSKA